MSIFVEGIKNRDKALEFEHKAKYHGFRAAIEEKNDGYLLRIFGDSQENVDDFIFLVLEQDLELMRFLAGARRPIH